MKIAAFPAAFGDEVNVADHHAPVDRLAHIVDSEQRRRYAGQCFHLHARFAVCLHGAEGMDGMRLFVHREGDLRVGQHQHVAHGNQFRCLLAAHDTGDLRDGQNIAFFNLFPADRIEDLRAYLYAARGRRLAVRHRLL